MKFEKIEAGMVLYDVHSHKMGNTTIRSLGVWTVRVISVDKERKSARVSWNGNREETYYRAQLEKLKAKPPVLVRTSFGAYRRQTKEEKAAAKEAK
jgi:hypothetical protein